MICVLRVSEEAFRRSFLGAHYELEFSVGRQGSNGQWVRAQRGHDVACEEEMLSCSPCDGRVGDRDACVILI